MTAQLVTLSGNYSTYGSRSRRARNNFRGRMLNDELMGAKDFWDWGKSTLKTVVSPVTSIAKGIGHMSAEAYRGAKDGDVLRVLASPFKGAGHIAGSSYRQLSEHAGYYYRPSYMQGWMQPVGGAMTAAGSIPTPASPFLLAGGVGLSFAGGLAGSKLANDRAKDAETQAEADAIIQKQKNKNMVYYAVGAVGVVALAYTMMN